MVGESCQKYCQKSFAPGDIIINDLDKEYESSKKSYEGLLIDFENKKTFSEDTLINHIIKHQRMLSLLAEVTISTECQRQTRLDKELFGEVLPNFVTRIKDIVYPDNSQKERYIQKYQKWLQKYHNRIKEASDSHMDLLGKMGEADKSIKEIDKLSNLLLKKVSDTKKGITNVGYLLQRSDSRSGAEET